MEFSKIMIPVDGSEYSVRAAAYAADFARITGAELLLIHCHKAFPAVLGEPYYQNAVNRILKQANQVLEPFRTLFAEKGVPYTERLMEGPARERIPEVARIEKYDLIVVGSRGLSNLEGLFLGSVTHRVLRAAPCPVTVIR